MKTATQIFSGNRVAARSLAAMNWDSPGIDKFHSDPVPDEDVQTILALATQAPSRFNCQPWRFVIVRDPEQRERLGQASSADAGIFEAPVVIVAFARPEAWSEGHRAKSHGTSISLRQDAPGADRDSQISVWLNRHVMVAFTYLMVAAESLGWDTAPMENFDAAAVRVALNLPDDAEVVAMLAVGRRRGARAAFPERLPVEQVAFAERFGNPWCDPTLAAISA